MSNIIINDDMHLGRWYSLPVGTKIKATDMWGRTVGWGTVGVEDHTKVEQLNGSRVKLVDHKYIAYICFRKMEAFVTEGHKGRYRHVTVNVRAQYLTVRTPMGDFNFGDTVYEQYKRWCNDLVVT